MIPYKNTWNYDMESIKTYTNLIQSL